MLKRKYRYLISYNFKSNYANGFGEMDITVNGKVKPNTINEIRNEINNLLLEKDDKIKSPTIVILNIFKF